VSPFFYPKIRSLLARRRGIQPIQRVYWPEYVIDWLGRWRPAERKLQSFRRKWPFCVDLPSVWIFIDLGLNNSWYHVKAESNNCLIFVLTFHFTSWRFSQMKTYAWVSKSCNFLKLCMSWNFLKLCLASVTDSQNLNMYYQKYFKLNVIRLRHICGLEKSCINYLTDIRVT
jgi:hypothetical protein